MAGAAMTDATNAVAIVQDFIVGSSLFVLATTDIIECYMLSSPDTKSRLSIHCRWRFLSLSIGRSSPGIHAGLTSFMIQSRNAFAPDLLSDPLG